MIIAHAMRGTQPQHSKLSTSPYLTSLPLPQQLNSPNPHPSQAQPFLLTYPKTPTHDGAHIPVSFQSIPKKMDIQNTRN